MDADQRTWNELLKSERRIPYSGNRLRYPLAEGQASEEPKKAKCYIKHHE